MVTTQPVRLDSLSIQGFRGIRELSVEFSPPRGERAPVLVVGGPNGGGKTTLLEALLLALGRRELVRGQYGAAAVGPGFPDYSIVLEIWDPAGPNTVRCSKDKHPLTKYPCVYVPSWRSPTPTGALGLSAATKSKRAKGLAHDHLGRLKQYLIDAKAHDRMQDSVRSGGVPHYAKTIEQLQWAWSRFYPEHPGRFSADPVSNEVDAGFDLFFSRDSGTVISVDYLSTGQQEILCLIGSLVLDPQSAIVLIDEPELHLDIQWHRTVLDVLRALRPDCQFVVATHSPAVFDSVLSSESYYMIGPDDPRNTTWGPRPAPHQEASA